MRTETLSQADPGFYPTFGPFFVSAEVRQATGSAMTSEPAYRWTAVQDAGQTVAFAGLRPQKNGGAEFVAVYAQGGNVDAKRLAVQAALDDAKGQRLSRVKILAKVENAQFYRDLGFESGLMRGGFIALEKAL